MTVSAYTSTYSQVSGYFRIGLDSVSVGVSQTFFVAKQVSLEIESLGIPDPDLFNYNCIWIAEFTFDTIYANTSKLRSSVQKYTLGYWETDYWGAISASGYLQYLSQRLPTQKCMLSRDAYNYPSLVTPRVQGLAYEVLPVSSKTDDPVQTSTTLHYLLDQVNPIGSTLQIQYRVTAYNAVTTPPIYWTQF